MIEAQGAPRIALPGLGEILQPDSRGTAIDDRKRDALAGAGRPGDGADVDIAPGWPQDAPGKVGLLAGGLEGLGQRDRLD